MCTHNDTSADVDTCHTRLIFVQAIFDHVTTVSLKFKNKKRCMKMRKVLQNLVKAGRMHYNIVIHKIVYDKVVFSNSCQADTE